MRLDLFDNQGFDRGRPWFVEALWIVAQWLLVASWVPGSAHRTFLLRLFGARIGTGAVLRPRMRVKWPWRLRMGDHCWIGEGVWIDNLDWVSIGNHCCISQGAYFCTGSHCWNRDFFDLVTRPITLEDQVWVSATAVVGPGVTLHQGAVLSLGSVATRDLGAGLIYYGNPATPIRGRERSDP